MQIWSDGALEERVATSGTIIIKGADPLARRALAAALGVAGLGANIARGEADTEPGPVGGAGDIVLWDDGPAPTKGSLRPASESEAPWLALVASGGRARAALSGGFKGAVGRDAPPELLAAAIGAVRSGLVTVDPRFASDVLPAPTQDFEPLQLTPRECQVLELMAEGLSNKEIGSQLGVSPHTAKFHVTALLDKLGAETRTEAVVLAARAGLLAL